MSPEAIPPPGHPLSRLFLAPDGAVRSGWKAGGFFLAYGLLGTGLALVLKVTGLTRQLGPWFAAVVAALASLACVKVEGRRFRDLGFWPGGRWATDFLAGTAGGILLILATALLVRGAGGFHWERTPGLDLRSLLGAAWMFLGVGFHEELVSRGYPFQRLVAGAGVWTGQLLFAALFALGHWGNPGMSGATRIWATLNIGLAAVLLGFCYLRTRSLAAPIGLHLGWNWAQGSLLGFGVSGTTDVRGFWTPVFHGKPEWLTGGAFGLEASLPCTLVCGLFIVALWRWKGRPSAGASTASAS